MENAVKKRLTEAIRREYDRLDCLCGVSTAEMEIVISERSVRRLGSFRPPRSNAEKPRIMISTAICDDEAQFWDTVRHEYAHAVIWLLYPRERHGHDAVWKSVCRRIGCTPKSTAPVSEESAALRRERAKYVIRCKNCGAETYYLRAGKIVQRMQSNRAKTIYCTKCGSHDLRLYERG